MKWNPYFVLVTLMLLGCNLPIDESLDDFVPDYDCRNLANLGFIDKPVWVCLEPRKDSVSDALIIKENFIVEADSIWVVDTVYYSLYLPISDSIPNLDSAKVSYFHGTRTLIIESGKDTAWAVIIGRSTRIYDRQGEDTLWSIPTVSKLEFNHSRLNFSSGEQTFGKLKTTKGNLYKWKYRVSGVESC